MAVKWAVANGNWNAGATWNGGVVPADGDEVYANGYVVNVNVSSINMLSLSNRENLNFGINNGGYFNVTTNCTISCDLISWDSYIIGVSGDRRITVNGNIYGGENALGIATNTLFYRVSGSNIYITINGNVDASNSYSVFEAVSSIYIIWNINGNVIISEYLCHGGFIGGTNALGVNGNLTRIGISDIFLLTGSNSGSPTFTFSGYVTGNISMLNIQDNAVIQIGKGIRYTTSFKFKLHCLRFLDDDWEITYIGPEPNPNPYIIQNVKTIAQTYPTEDKVLAPTQYGAQMELVGSYTPDYPPESVVLKDFEYGDGDDRKTGTMVQEVNVEVGCVTPEDVRKDVPLVGMGVVGSLVVPSADDVREGVVFDNGSVGTLIVQGGGDRLRIADFGYYTNAQSDTYIVDLTEQDKPKFAVAEERVLIEMFPDLDLDNIADKYFDDLFVKYLKYRLIVEYYRTAGINSTFTPSEPTTEIVNYQNVRNEVWLNSANIYLKAWSKKYPESIVKPQRILL